MHCKKSDILICVLRKERKNRIRGLQHFGGQHLMSCNLLHSTETSDIMGLKECTFGDGFLPVYKMNRFFNVILLALYIRYVTQHKLKRV